MLEIRKCFYALCILSLSIAGLKCASKGFLTREYEKSFYQVPKLMPDTLTEHSNRFIFYGDSRQGWRLEEKLLKKKNWLTWKMALVPFYQIYLSANIVVGCINYLRSVPDYGTAEREMVRTAIYAEVKRSKAAFVIHNGDMVTDGRRPRHWASFVRENKYDSPLLPEVPFLPAVGNHEQVNDTCFGKPNYAAVFSYPQFYQIDLDHASLFFVDSEVILDEYQQIPDVEQDQLFAVWFISDDSRSESAWLERKLAESKKTFKIIVMHHPSVSFNHHHADWTDEKNGRNLPEKRRRLLQLFSEQNVQLIFSGHEHVYETSIIRRIESTGSSEPDIYQLTSGGGGVPLREKSNEKTIRRYHQNYQDQGLSVKLLRQEKIYHYCVITIEKNCLDIQVVQVTRHSQQPTRIVDTLRIPSNNGKS